PTQVVDNVVVVLRLGLIRLRRRSKLEARSEQSEFIDTARQVAGGSINANIRCGDWVYVVGGVVDVDQTEPDVIDESRREDMGFRDDEQAVVNRKLIGEVQVRSAGCRTQRRLQSAGAE